MSNPLEIAEADIEEAARLAERTRRAPWYVEMFLAFGGWVAGLLAAVAIFAFVSALMPDGVRDDEWPSLLACLIGVAFIIFGVRIGRNRSGEFSRHFAIASIAAGLTAASTGFWYFLYSVSGNAGASDMRAGLTGLVTSTAFAAAGHAVATRVKDGILTFLATLAFFALLALSINLLAEDVALAAFPRWLIAPVALISGLFLITTPIGRRVHAAAGAALMIAPMAYYEFLDNRIFARAEPAPVASALASESVFALAILYCLYVLRARYAPPALLAATGLLLAGSWFLPNAGSVAIILILAGFAANHRGLAAIGVVALSWFLGRFYYDLSMSLLEKSALMAGLGVATLGGALAVRAMGQRLEERREAAPSRALSQRRGALVALGFGALLIGALGLVNHSVWRLETAFREARVIYLPLGPVDPRSLIQGDYMRLRFQESVFPAPEFVGGMAQTGQVFLKLDMHDVASFARLAPEGEEPASDEIRINYVKAGDGTLRYCPESFFFQEGEAELFAGARFAALRVAPDGRARLFALADANRNIIRPGTEKPAAP